MGNTENEQNCEELEEEEGGRQEVAWVDNGPLHMLHIHCLPNKGCLGL